MTVTTPEATPPSPPLPSPVPLYLPPNQNETLEANPQMGGAGAAGGAAGGGPANVFQRSKGGMSRTVDSDGLPRIGEVGEGE